MNIGKQDFFADVYSIVEQIPFGKVLSYGALASLAGHPERSRMVGQAMHNAPADSCLPCHRVVNSNGRTAPGWTEHNSLLAAENITFRRNGYVDMAKHLWKPE